MKEAKAALMTGMSTFRIAPFDAKDSLILYVNPNWARPCPPTPAVMKRIQSFPEGLAAPGLFRRIRKSSGTNSNVVM